MNLDELMGATDVHLASSRRLRRGEQAYAADTKGLAWRIAQGVLRLDHDSHCVDERSFAGLARRGDVIGAETLLRDRYAFSATALTDCVLEPWAGTPGASGVEELFDLVTSIEQRSAAVLRMRCGSAQERVRHVLQLMAPALSTDGKPIALPALRHLADMTVLSIETVSRTLSALRSEGVVHRPRRGRPASPAQSAG